MIDALFSYGSLHPDLNPERLVTSAAAKTLKVITAAACRDFELCQLGFLQQGDQTIADIIVVDCLNDQVPSRNPVGIKNRERLALKFPVKNESSPDVLTLRKTFPVTIHQNNPFNGKPLSLCLYFEPWSAVARTWTPQKHLKRVFWWLSETAKGTLHRDDQPVEQLYFDTQIEIVLPRPLKRNLKTMLSF